MFQYRTHCSPIVQAGAYAIAAVIVSTLVAWSASSVGTTVLALIDSQILASHAQGSTQATTPRVDEIEKSKAAIQVATASSKPPTSNPPAPPERPIQPLMVVHNDADADFHDGEEGTYRTYCVRLCDGYYWPISFSATADRFAQDTATCSDSCGSPTRLFVHRSPGGNQTTMTTLDGIPYKSLKTAFLFRTRFDNSCKCRAHPWEQQAQDRHKLYAAAQALKTQKLATPALRQEHKRLQEQVATAVTTQSASKAQATRVAEQALATLAKTIDAQPLNASVRPSNRKTQRIANREAFRPSEGTIMRLGANRDSNSDPKIWRPASGVQRGWQDRAFSGN